MQRGIQPEHSDHPPGSHTGCNRYNLPPVGVCWCRNSTIGVGSVGLMFLNHSLTLCGTVSNAIMGLRPLEPSPLSGVAGIAGTVPQPRFGAVPANMAPASELQYLVSL